MNPVDGIGSTPWMNTLNKGVENKTKCFIRKLVGLIAGLLEEGLLDSAGSDSSAARSSILRARLVGSSTLVGSDVRFCFIRSLMFKVNSPNRGKAGLGRWGPPWGQDFATMGQEMPRIARMVELEEGLLCVPWLV